MTRYKLTLEYDGTTLIGWQENAQGPSVQSLLQDAIFKFCQQRVEVIAAGRTDAGVHALGMVCHFDIVNNSPPAGESTALPSVGGPGSPLRFARDDNYYDDTPHRIARAPLGSATPPHGGSLTPQTIMRALNFYLNDSPVSVLSCEIVQDDFHARFSCQRRNYRYIILNRGAKPTLDANRVWWLPRPLDIEKMQEASAKLIGNHDFTSFRSSECQAKSPVKTLDEIKIYRDEGRGMRDETISASSFIPHPSFLILEFSARSFLHHQVRNMVGTLVEIGLGKDLDIEKILAARDRSAAGPTAPACGLYFVSAEY